MLARAFLRQSAAARHLVSASYACLSRDVLDAAGGGAPIATAAAVEKFDAFDARRQQRRRRRRPFSSSTSSVTSDPEQPLEDSYDAIVVGGGHNGLVAALLLAREGGEGFRVALFDESPVLGGAARTEKPFGGQAADLRHSTGAYLLGPFPPELLDFCGLGDLPIVRRSPHYFLPTSKGGVFFDAADESKTRESFLSSFSRRDWLAMKEMERELSQLRESFAPAMLCPSPRDASEAADLFFARAKSENKEKSATAFVDLVEGSVARYLDRFSFDSALLRAMFCATDGLSGATASPFDDGTGYNFLLHNMVRLRETSGAWALVKGGMGTVTQRLADNARLAGAALFAGRGVASIDARGGGGSESDVDGVTLSCGRRVRARVGVVAACDPWKLCSLAPTSVVPPSFRERLDDLYVPATTFKLNLALKALPDFACLRGRRNKSAGSRGVGGGNGDGDDSGGPEHRTTAHLLAESSESDDGGGRRDPVQLLHDAAVAALRGETAVDAWSGRHPPIEFYFHSAADPSVREGGGEGGGDRTLKETRRHHSAALFVQLAPHAPGVSFLGKKEAKQSGPPSPPLHDTGSAPSSFEVSRRAWTDEAKRKYSESLLKAAEDKWCPGLTSLVADAVAFAPPDIESRFGITGGHIHHVQNTASFGDRVPLRVGGGGGEWGKKGDGSGGSGSGGSGGNCGSSNLFFASAGAHPGGSVTGAPGHNAAAALLLLSASRKNRERVLSWPTIKGAGAGASAALWEAFVKE